VVLVVAQAMLMALVVLVFLDKVIMVDLLPQEI
jgi:hypothetical protein